VRPAHWQQARHHWLLLLLRVRPPWPKQQLSKSRSLMQLKSCGHRWVLAELYTAAAGPAYHLLLKHQHIMLAAECRLLP
jgi:hypothetical protein